MKYIKIQTEVMEALEKNKPVYLATLKDDSIALTLDNYVMYRIPQCRFYLNLNKSNTKIIDADKLFGFETETAWQTGELKRIDDKIIIKIANQNGHAWVNEKLLKYFDKDCKFEIALNKPELSPVKVIENGACAGIVMPYIHKN